VRSKRLLSLLAATLMLAVPAAADAARPERVPPPDELADDTFDAGVVCPFTLRYQELVNKETTTLVSETRLRVTGAYKGRFTNVDTGASIVVNASGPQFFTLDGDIVHAVLPGPQVFLLFDTDADGPGAFLARGRSTATRDLTTGAITELHLGGTVTDLCAALA
jgi:hypothetical protein